MFQTQIFTASWLMQFVWRKPYAFFLNKVFFLFKAKKSRPIIFRYFSNIALPILSINDDEFESWWWTKSKYANFTDTCYKHLLHYSYSPSYVFNVITSLSHSLLSLNLFQQNLVIYSRHSWFMLLSCQMILFNKERFENISPF